MGAALSIGYNLNYWNKHLIVKNREIEDEGIAVNPNYVEMRYSNFKEEFLNYKHLNVREFKETIVPKVNVYYISELAKSITAHIQPHMRQNRHILINTS